MFDAIIIKPFEYDDENIGGIIIPDLGKEKNEKGTVVAVGPGRHVAGIGFIPTELEVGEVVVLPIMGATKLEFEGEDYYIISENQILAKIEKK
jgi:chaperonin GroES